VVEFDPTTFEIVWQYGSADGEDFFYSPYISSVQRLPNGNTLINAGVGGHILEVTRNKQIVWEHQFVVESSGIKADWLYRAIRVPPEWLPEGVNESLGNYPTWESLFEQD
jgi:hypothetical protein